MYTLSKQINVILLCAAIATTTSIYTMENESKKTSEIWYKKRSVRIGATITTVAALYALAVRMGIVAVPFLLAGFFVKVVQDTVVHAEQNNDVVNNGNNIRVEEQQDDFHKQVSDVDHDGSDNNVVDDGMVKQEIQQASVWNLNQLFNKVKDISHTFRKEIIESVNRIDLQEVQI